MCSKLSNLADRPTHPLGGEMLHHDTTCQSRDYPSCVVTANVTGVTCGAHNL